MEEFAACGLQVNNLTRNLHENGIVGIMTGYEEKFHALGTPINRCEVVCKPFVLPKEDRILEDIVIVPRDPAPDAPRHGYMITEDEA